MVSSSFLGAWQSGDLCLHPTDTLPGLSFDPSSDLAYRQLLAYKQRSPQKSFVCLVASTDQALGLWQPLHERAMALLDQLWPGPYTLLWPARTGVPEFLLQNGRLALRLPRWPQGAEWMAEVVAGRIFPSTSLNLSGMPAAKTWSEALTMVSAEVYVPSLVVEPEFLGHGSTIVDLDSGDFLQRV